MSTRIKLLNLFLTLVLCVSAYGVSDKLCRVPIMPVSEIEAGMRGIGKTVFQGDSIEEFEVKILGTLKNFLPKKDIILAELLGDKLRYTGVIGGMSGSPVYIDGKLIGAVAYGWSFSKDPIAGITPIEQMLEIELEDRAPGGAAAPQGGAGAGRSSGVPQLYNPFEEPPNPLFDNLSTADRPAPGSFTAGGASLTRLEVPLIFSGCHPEVVNRYGKFFRRLGLVPLMGGNSGSLSANDEQSFSFEPGSPISAQLVRGDISLAATGTITYREDERILAFGHPFMQFGPVDFPMTAAEVVSVLPNVARSFKISNSTGFMGSIKIDHSNGIYGIVGSQPKMVPVEIQLSQAGGKVETYHYELIRHKLLTPMLGGLIVVNTLLSNGNAASEQIYKVSGKIKIKQAQPVKIDNMYAGSGAALQLTQQLQTILSYLYNNYYGPAEVEKLELGLEISQGFPRAQLSEVYLDQNTVHPGDTVRVEVVLDPFTEAEFKEQFTVVAPQTDTQTRLFLLVGSGDQLTRAEFQLSPNRFRYTSLSHLVRLINASRKNNCLYLKVLSQAKGFILEGQEMTDLPPSVWKLLKSDKTAGGMLPLNDITLAEFERPTNYIINGFKVLFIEVKPRP